MDVSLLPTAPLSFLVAKETLQLQGSVTQSGNDKCSASVLPKLCADPWAKCLPGGLTDASHLTLTTEARDRIGILAEESKAQGGAAI